MIIDCSQTLILLASRSHFSEQRGQQTLYRAPLSQEAKKKAEAEASSLVEAYEVRVNALDWMSQETIAEEIRKLETLSVKIGYPDE